MVVDPGWTGGFLDEEAYQWVRDVDLLTDEECLLPYAVGLDLDTAFLAAAARLVAGLSEPVHFVNPRFNPKIPGSWLVGLSHIALDPRLPSPFTPTGERPTGPAWYQTDTVAYARELGHDVASLEAYLRRETGADLDPWHDRLRTAYLDALADLGVTKDLDGRQFLTAIQRHKDTDPAMAAVLTAIKATVKGGVGKLRERPQGRGLRTAPVRRRDAGAGDQRLRGTIARRSTSRTAAAPRRTSRTSPSTTSTTWTWPTELQADHGEHDDR